MEKQLPNPIKSTVFTTDFRPTVGVRHFAFPISACFIGRGFWACQWRCGRKRSVRDLSAQKPQSLGHCQPLRSGSQGVERGKWGRKQSKVDWDRRTRPTFAPSRAITPLSLSRASGCSQEGRATRQDPGERIARSRRAGGHIFNVKSQPVVSRGVYSFYVVALVGSGSGAAPVSCLDRAYLARVVCQAPIMSGDPSFDTR